MSEVGCFILFVGRYEYLFENRSFQSLLGIPPLLLIGFTQVFTRGLFSTPLYFL